MIGNILLVVFSLFINYFGVFFVIVEIVVLLIKSINKIGMVCDNF